MDVLIMDCGDAKYNGECKIDGYKDKIELLSFSNGVAQQITGDVSNTKRTSGKPNFQDFTVTKYTDLSTVPLTQSCISATLVAKIIITVGQNDTGTVIPFFTYTLTDVVISSVSTGGGGGGKPQETVTLNYATITYNYVVQAEAGGKQGTSSFGWDAAQNKPAAAAA
jgi:type VI secretion system secreted protein Hcp